MTAFACSCDVDIKCVRRLVRVTACLLACLIGCLGWGGWSDWWVDACVGWKVGKWVGRCVNDESKHYTRTGVVSQLNGVLSSVKNQTRTGSEGRNPR